MIELTEWKINYSKPIEIIMEFPVSIISQCLGRDNLDEIWDDNIMPIIIGTLRDHNIHIKESKLVLINKIENHEVTLCYSMMLIVPPPLFSFAWIINALKEKCYEKGLCIKVKNDYGNYEIIYQNFNDYEKIGGRKI